VTAYDEYAVDAFERGAIDYLLKPIVEDRLRATIARLRAAIAQPPVDLSALLAQVARRLQPQTSDYLSWVRAGVGDTVRLIAVDDVLFCSGRCSAQKLGDLGGRLYIQAHDPENSRSLDSGQCQSTPASADRMDLPVVAQ
jgi:hypothetical protein